MFLEFLGLSRDPELKVAVFGRGESGRGRSRVREGKRESQGGEKRGEPGRRVRESRRGGK